MRLVKIIDCQVCVGLRYFDVKIIEFYAFIQIHMEILTLSTKFLFHHHRNYNSHITKQMHGAMNRILKCESSESKTFKFIKIY